MIEKLTLSQQMNLELSKCANVVDRIENALIVNQNVKSAIITMVQSDEPESFEPMSSNRVHIHQLSIDENNVFIELTGDKVDYRFLRLPLVRSSLTTACKPPEFLVLGNREINSVDFTDPKEWFEIESEPAKLGYVNLCCDVLEHFSPSLNTK